MTNIKRVLRRILAGLLIAVPSAATAHHSGSEFDLTKRVSTVGTVKSWQWRNPHAWLQVLVPGANGAMQEYGFELGSPNTLFRNGYRKDSWKPGDKVKVYYSPRHDGSPGGELTWAKDRAGTWLRWGPNAGTTPPAN